MYSFEHQCFNCKSAQPPINPRFRMPYMAVPYWEEELDLFQGEWILKIQQS